MSTDITSSTKEEVVSASPNRRPPPKTLSRLPMCKLVWMAEEGL